MSETITPDDLFKRMAVPRFVVVACANKGLVVSNINDLALKYFNLSAEQIVERGVVDFMDAANAQHFQQSFEVAMDRGQSVTIQALPGVPSAVKVYGFYISPIKDEAGKVLYLDIIGQLDVTDESILQRDRDDAVSLLTSVFEVSEIGIVVTDGQGKIIRVNEGFVRTYGWEKDDLMNTDMVSLITPDEREAVAEIHAECIQSGRHHTGELKIIRKDGSVANVLSTTATLELSQKRRYQVTTVMDITLRKRMEESLRFAKDEADAANRAKSTFLANMSHELRTPLNAIIGFSEMMIKETFGELANERYAEYMDDIHVSARHLLEIINEVLDMSKIEAGRIELDEAEVHLEDLLKSVVRMMASRAFGNNVTLTMNLAENLDYVYADERLLRQGFINLLANAVKFSNDGGDVIVEARTLQDQSIEVRIIDHGVGIPKEKIEEALQPFGQISDRAENAEYQGTGLGLPLAKAMVELHEGILQLESDVGEGATVIITFPSFRTLQNEKNASKLRLN